MPKQAHTRPHPTSIRDVLKNAVPDIFFAPLDQKLNWALRWTGAFLGAGVVAVFFLGSVLWSIADFGFFRSSG